MGKCMIVRSASWQESLPSLAKASTPPSLSGSGPLSRPGTLHHSPKARLTGLAVLALPFTRPAAVHQQPQWDRLLKIALASCTPAASTAPRMAGLFGVSSALRGPLQLAAALSPRPPGCSRATNHIVEWLQEHRFLCLSIRLGGSNQPPEQTRTRISFRPAVLLRSTPAQGS
jgi:hypothetical protein